MLTVILVLATAVLLADPAVAIESVSVTIQGVLSDGSGPVPDGTYTAQVTFKRPDGYSETFINVELETVDGRFTEIVEGVSTEIFECDLGDASCVQALAMTMSGQAAFPDVAFTNAGRAAVATRLNGDIQTSPGQLAIPSYDPFVDRHAVITNQSAEFFDDNGDRLFDLNTSITGLHPVPTLAINGIESEFNGRTKVNSELLVDQNNDGSPDFAVSNVTGIQFHSLPLTVDPVGAGGAALNVDPTGVTTIEGLFDGFADFKVLANGTINSYASEFWIDRNKDFVPDFRVNPTGTVEFNTDLTGGMDATFGTTSFQFNKGVTINPGGTGNPPIRLGEPAGAISCDFNQDNTAEFFVDNSGVTITKQLDVDFNGSGFGENLSVAPTGMFLKVDGTFPGQSMRITGAEAAWDVDQDNSRELVVQDNHTSIYTETDVWTDPTAGFPSCSYTSGQYLCDPDQDGNAECAINGSGADFYGDCDFYGDPTLANPSLTAGNGFLEFDMDQDGTAEWSLEEVGGAYTLHWDGDLEATGAKNFVQEHPTDPALEIVYVSLESGEAGTYTRGSAQLSGGVAVVTLPEHFGLVTSTEGLTVQVTPRGPVLAMLYVERVTPCQLVVRSSDPADRAVPFDFMVNGVRLGYEDHQVIRERRFAHEGS